MLAQLDVDLKRRRESEENRGGLANRFAGLKVEAPVG
jgi:hypothetical protein